MATLPWTRSVERPPAPAAEVLVLASRLELGSYRHTTAFLRAALAVRRQVLHSPGAVGVSLRARPIRRTYWTLSAWNDRAALDAFVGSTPHVEVMRRFGSRLAGSAFTTWEVPAVDLPTGANGATLWREARLRLGAVAVAPSPPGSAPVVASAPAGDEPEADR